MMERDLIGYGPNPPVVEWPNGARIAVSVVVNYEEGSEYSTLDGDPAGETGGESPSPVTPGERALAKESFSEYCRRGGVRGKARPAGKTQTGTPTRTRSAGGGAGAAARSGTGCRSGGP